MKKSKVIISGINLFEGGGLSLLKDCLFFLNESKFIVKYNFFVLVHKKNLFNPIIYSNLCLLEFPLSRKSYLFRLFYEYIFFKKLAKENNVVFWLSLHDITPYIGNIPQAVYCHNPSPFKKCDIKDIYTQPTYFFFNLFYKFLYKINIHKNKYVVVQQFWMKEKFSDLFKINRHKIIVAKPSDLEIVGNCLLSVSNPLNKVFFYPSFPRPFKNIEKICEAVNILILKNITNFNVILTIDGTENPYSKSIYKKFKNFKNIAFIGIQKREAVFKFYDECDCLIFPSKLETWGLPISEFKRFNKPMIVANLPYAKETVGNYSKVNFFEPSNANHLATIMENLINNKNTFDVTQPQTFTEPYAKNWDELFSILLKQ